MFRKMDSSQKFSASTVQPAWTELKCANTVYREINFYVSLSEVKYAAVTTSISIDTSPEHSPCEDLYHCSGTSSIKTG